MSDIYRAWSYNDAALYHHGTKGMKWGIRRFQNADGTLTPAGRKRYAAADGVEPETKAQAKALKYSEKKVTKALARNRVDNLDYDKIKEKASALRELGGKGNKRALVEAKKWERYAKEVEKKAPVIYRTVNGQVVGIYGVTPKVTADAIAEYRRTGKTRENAKFF